MQNRGGISSALSKKFYAQPALVPPMPWLSTKAPATPAVRASGTPGVLVHRSRCHQIRRASPLRTPVAPHLRHPRPLHQARQDPRRHRRQLRRSIRQHQRPVRPDQKVIFFHEKKTPPQIGRRRLKKSDGDSQSPSHNHLVTIMLRLIRTIHRHIDVVSLFLSELRQLATDLAEVQTCHLFIQFF